VEKNPDELIALKIDGLRNVASSKNFKLKTFSTNLVSSVEGNNYLLETDEQTDKLTEYQKSKKTHTQNKVRELLPSCQCILSSSRYPVAR
jgi:hypothetical protein